MYTASLTPQTSCEIDVSTNLAWIQVTYSSPSNLLRVYSATGTTPVAALKYVVAEKYTSGTEMQVVTGTNDMIRIGLGNTDLSGTTA